MPIGPPGKVAYKILNNRVVEAVIVAFIAAGFIATTVIDGILGTRIERKFINSLQGRFPGISSAACGRRRSSTCSGASSA